jgi:hypothetical protein
MRRDGYEGQKGQEHRLRGTVQARESQMGAGQKGGRAMIERSEESRIRDSEIRELNRERRYEKQERD